MFFFDPGAPLREWAGYFGISPTQYIRDLFLRHSFLVVQASTLVPSPRPARLRNSTPAISQNLRHLLKVLISIVTEPVRGKQIII